ncbi:Nickel transport complex protein, NikM subunit, transmembrane [Desulfofundulus kuznetsovii DSM 6115]|uniref:Nickel transport complex protein, NikM subunit, transmembrane n=1 Tax=Desulfofundulus kuznetsovii (strain DSM 6115 / VKM B-1805 / 17) TaxID=760568 RepID=A0AAU8PIN7_DESK7|nr:Nickel transport complex protein, NikM subunit, transmembrane [Desulfofundulus kuznetsovii DSM 6115]
MAPHNIWIECPYRARPGEELTARIRFGHDFVVQGKADPSRTKTWLISPAGNRIPLAVEVGEADLTAVFRPPETGVYTLLAEYDGKVWSIGSDGRHLRGPRADHPGVTIVKAVYYYQYAKALVAVERDGPWPGPSGAEFEIVPRPPAEERLEVAVLYEGRPVGEVKVQAFRSGNPLPHSTSTDAEGVVSFPFRDGKWMILASYSDPRKGAPGWYDERVLTAVFTFTTI